MAGPFALMPRVLHCIQVRCARRRQLRRQLADEHRESRVIRHRSLSAARRAR